MPFQVNDLDEDSSDENDYSVHMSDKVCYVVQNKKLVSSIFHKESNNGGTVDHIQSLDNHTKAAWFCWEKKVGVISNSNLSSTHDRESLLPTSNRLLRTKVLSS